MLVGQQVVQVAQVGDAEIGDLEHEDRVAVVAHAAEVADVGRQVPDLEVPELVLVHRHAALGIPAPQGQRDLGFHDVRVMGVMGVVHGDDVGRRRRPDPAVVVGDRGDPLGAFDQEAGVAEEGEAQAAWRRHGGRDDPRLEPCDRQALGGGGADRKQQRQGGEQQNESDLGAQFRAPRRPGSGDLHHARVRAREVRGDHSLRRHHGAVCAAAEASRCRVSGRSGSPG